MDRGEEMAFEDSPQVGGAASRYRGEGFRQEPDFRDGITTFAPTPSNPGGDNEEATATLARRVAPPNLDYVFDDPADGEPGRDRILVHGLWELILAAAVAGLGYLLYQEQTTAFTADGLRPLLLALTALGVLSAAVAVSLRAGVINLAVGPVAVAAAIYYHAEADGSGLRIVLVVLGLAAVVGLVQALIITGLHVPAWAVSLAVGIGLSAWAVEQSAVETGSYDARPHAYWWLGGFCAVSLLASIVGLIPSVRRAFGRFRPVGDPAHRRGVVAAAIAGLAVVVSTVLAGLAGLLTVWASAAGSGIGVAASSNGFDATALALGAALLGGTSAFGRRGGIFGTILASALLTVAMAYAQATGREWNILAFAAVAIGLGLAVTRLVERFGRPAPLEPGEADDDWAPTAHAASGRSWQAGPTTAVGGLWASDEAWGSGDR